MYINVIVLPDILYTYILINGRLEASGMESVLVFSKSSHHKCVVYCLEIHGMQLIIKLSLKYIQYLQMGH